MISTNPPHFCKLKFKLIRATLHGFCIISVMFFGWFQKQYSGITAACACCVSCCFWKLKNVYIFINGISTESHSSALRVLHIVLLLEARADLVFFFFVIHCLHCDQAVICGGDLLFNWRSYVIPLHWPEIAQLQAWLQLYHVRWAIGLSEGAGPLGWISGWSWGCSAVTIHATYCSWVEPFKIVCSYICNINFFISWVNSCFNFSVFE